MSIKFKARILLSLSVIGGAFLKVSDSSAAYAMKRCAPGNIVVAMPRQMNRHSEEGSGENGTLSYSEMALRGEWFKSLESNSISKLKEFLNIHGEQCANWSNMNGVLSLNYAAFYSGSEVVKFLLDHGANVDSSDRFGRTPLMCALDRLLRCRRDGSAYEIIAFLCVKGANVNLKDARGNTAFHRVCAAGIPKLMNLFLSELGADMNTPNGDGMMPVSIYMNALCRNAQGLQRAI